MNKLFRSLISAFSIIILALILIFSTTLVNSLKIGVDLCIYVLIPSLFVFLIMSDLFLKLKLLDALLKPFGFLCGKLFHMDASLGPVFALSLFCGYPVGARLLNELCVKKVISKEYAERMICFCMNSGPAFLIGSVSIPLFGNAKPGFYMFLCHILAAFCVGILSGLGKKSCKINYDFKKMPFSEALVSSLNSSVRAMTSICGFVLLFCGIIGLLKEFSLLDLFTNEAINSVLIGVIEVSNGVFSCRSLPFPIAFVVTVGITAFGGMCVHCQIKDAVKSSEISLKKFFLYRVLYTSISVGCAIFICKFVEFPAYVFLSSDLNIKTSAPTPFGSILLIALCLCFLCCDKKSGIISGRILKELKRRSKT